MVDLAVLQAAVDDALCKHSEGIVSAWVLMVETQDIDGGCTLTKMGSDGSPQWHSDGMLHAGLHGTGMWEDAADEDEDD